MNRLKEAMTLLIANDGPLPAEWLDHPLTGDWAGHRECHVGGDFLLIYIVDDTGKAAWWCSFVVAHTPSCLNSPRPERLPRSSQQRVAHALVDKLGASNQAMAEGAAMGKSGIAQVQSANRHFHHALLDTARSPRLRSILETMIDMPIIKGSFHIYTPQELEQSLHHHRDLTLAAQAADGELARQVIQLHLRIPHHRFMRHRTEYRQDTPVGAST
jgi:hypothetical protein